MGSALITTIASLPVDIAKTRIQNMRSINGKPEYAGMTVIVPDTSPFVSFKQVNCFSLLRNNKNKIYALFL